MAIDPISRASVTNAYVSDDVKLNNAEIPVTVFKEEDNGKPLGKGNIKDTQQQKKELTDAIEKANEFMRQKKTRCEFSYIETLKRVSITVFDNKTQKVIKEIPPEESLKAIEKIWEIAGLIVDEKR